MNPVQTAARLMTTRAEKAKNRRLRGTGIVAENYLWHAEINQRRAENLALTQVAWHERQAAGGSCARTSLPHRRHRQV